MTDDARHAELWCYFGKRGCGKTTRALADMRARERRIYLDPMYEHRDGVIVESYADLIAYVRPLRHARYSIVLRSLDPSDHLATLGLATSGTPEDPPLPGVTFLVDEADRLCSPSSIPPQLDRLANYGRHYRASALIVARRASTVHASLRALADRIHFGATDFPRDVDAVAQYIGPELAERVRQLSKPGDFVVYPDDLAPVTSPSDSEAADDATDDNNGAGPVRQRGADGEAGEAERDQ